MEMKMELHMQILPVVSLDVNYLSHGNHDYLNFTYHFDVALAQLRKKSLLGIFQPRLDSGHACGGLS